jgi:hypothetical protein
VSTAQALTDRMAETGRTRTKDGIFAIVSDDHNVHCLTEAMLDAWWASLPPTEKAVIYEADTDGIHIQAESQPHPEIKTLQEHASQFLRDMEQRGAIPQSVLQLL